MLPVRHDCRYCAACDRNILDFTMKTDREIQAFLHSNNGKICGKFRADQLNRPMQVPYPPRRRFRALAAGVATLLSLSQADAQLPTQTPTKTILPPPQKAPENDSKITETVGQDTVRIVSGRVLDAATGEPLIGVTIRFAQSKIGTISNWDGFFNLKIPIQDLESGPLELRLYYTGYTEKLLEMPPQVLQNDLALLPEFTQMQLSEHPVEFLGVIVREQPRLEYSKTPKARISLFFRRLFR